MPRVIELGRVLSRRDLSNGYFVLSVDLPRIAEAARPGEFIMLQVRSSDSPAWDPLLPRPFTFLRVHPPRMDLYVKVVGRGTALLSRAMPGDALFALGPLGLGFRPPADPGATPVFVAGGIGVAPFLHLAETLPREPAPVLLYGGRTSRDIQLVDEFETAGMRVEVATEDGSLGERGRVTALLERRLGRADQLALYACGPEPMMAAVARMARGRPCQVSLEARMGCGIGVCRGCAVPLAKGGYAEICVDGPVREASEIWS